MIKEVTRTQYSILDEAFQYFNSKLFNGELPDVMITLQRKSKAAGYHHFEKFEGRENKKERITEIALNPDVFSVSTDEEVMDTLVHEMVHHWQYFFGTPTRAGYHNREWAAKMKEVGLYPSSTGEPGGKETGPSMSDYIIDGGKFQVVCKGFLLKKNGIALYLNSVVESKEKKERKKTREKFVCKKCLQSAQAKKTAKLLCGDCMLPMKIEKTE